VNAKRISRIGSRLRKKLGFEDFEFLMILRELEWF
jgi:hypothetical protein